VRQFVDRLNEEGVRVYGRLSPLVLIALLQSVTAEFCQHLRSLDPWKPALFPVTWAGESESLNWFDTARELTERWHHQQQIRLATRREGIMTRELYHPVLETFVRALPFSYRGVNADAGTTLRIVIAGDCGGDWSLVRAPQQWKLSRSASGGEAARIEVPQEIAWRIFTKGIPREEAETASTVSGSRSLTETFFSTTAIIG